MDEIGTQCSFKIVVQQKRCCGAPLQPTFGLVPHTLPCVLTGDGSEDEDENVLPRSNIQHEWIGGLEVWSTLCLGMYVDITYRKRGFSIYIVCTYVCTLYVLKTFTDSKSTHPVGHHYKQRRDTEYSTQNICTYIGTYCMYLSSYVPGILGI